MNKHDCAKHIRMVFEALYFILEHRMGKTQHGSVLGFAVNVACSTIERLKKLRNRKGELKK